MNPTTSSLGEIRPDTDRKELLPVLQGIGFSKNQADIYMAALEMGPSSIWDIAKKSGLKRSTCYSLLEELALKGYASSSSDSKRTIYSVTSPKRLLLAARTRYNRLESAIGRLDALASRSSQKPLVRFYEGYEGVKEVYLSCCREAPKNSEIYYMGSDEITQERYPELLAEYARMRQELRIPIKVLFVDTGFNRASFPDNPKELRRTRYFPREKFNPPIEMQISGDRVVYISHAAHLPFAYVIENPTFADQERQKFDLLWEFAEE